MTKFVRDRGLITKKILEIRNPDYNTADYDTALLTWWTNIRSSGGLGLTYNGFVAFHEAGIEHWDLEADKAYFSTFKNRLRLDRLFPTPYYQWGAKVRIYDSRVFVMVQLHGGLAGYLDSLAGD